MGQTATVSTAIIDSSAIGRDVLTAADLAAAQAVLGIVPFDVTADYNFTGDITSSGDNKHYFVGQAGDADTAYLTTQYDGVNGQLASLATGSQSRRPLYVGGVATGTDSGILVGGSSAGYLRTGANTSVAWSNTAFVTYKDFRPQTDGDVECGRDGNRWESVYSVDGDFSGTVTTDSLVGASTTFVVTNSLGNSGVTFSGAGSVQVKAFGSVFQQFTATGISCDVSIFPTLNNVRTSGLSNNRWATVYGVDGSFSGNLTSEVGGSIRHYSTGTEGDTDTSFVEIGDDGTRHTIYTSRTGAGTPRNLRVGNSAHYMEVLPAQTKIDWYISGTKRFSVSASSTEFFNNLLPITSGLTFGGSAQRWATTYSVDGDFSGTVTLGGLVQSPIDTVFQRGGSNRFLLGAADTSFYTNLRTSADGYHNCGTSTHRWAGVYSYDGSFSGNLTSEVGGSYKLYNLGTEGDTDTEYLETSWDSGTAKIQTKNSGAGGLKRLDVLAGQTGMKAYANSTLILTSQWSYISMDNDKIRLDAPSGGYVGVRNGDLRPFDAVSPVNCGQPAFPWAGVYSVDGSFTGNLTSEVGGSNRLYNLGSDGDTDTEYLETSVSSNVFSIAPKATGSGANRQFSVGSSGSSNTTLIGNLVRIYNGNNLQQSCQGGYAAFYQSGIRPSQDGVQACGLDTLRWANVASVDGDFSGDVIMAANVDFTGLPTSDPSVAGRLWNDGGTMKISAG